MIPVGVALGGNVKPPIAMLTGNTPNVTELSCMGSDGGFELNVLDSLINAI